MLDPLVADLTAIAGQKPVSTKAKKSIAAFKVREGMPIGAMVTLRGDKMYEFLDRLISIALPRVRDFRGVSTKSFDGRGNYTLGVRDQLIFPEIDYARVEKLKGMNITIVTTAKDDNQARALLRQFGMPFRTAALRLEERKDLERTMSTTAKRVKDARKPKFSSRKHNRCKLCGRPRAFLRKFGVCRLCFRSLALQGEIPGVVKSSWYGTRVLRNRTAPKFLNALDVPSTASQTILAGSLATIRRSERGMKERA